jgi:type I restriction enzyme S subunit
MKDQKRDPAGLVSAAEIPSRWETLLNFVLFEERSETERDDLSLLSVTIDQGVLHQSELEDKKDISNLDKSKYRRVAPGDIVFNPMRMWQGAVGMSEYEGIVSPAYIVLKPVADVNPKYFHYLFRTPLYTTEAYRNSYGIVDDQHSLRYPDFRRMESIVPPRSEQDAIADYLDQKTAEIDDYVAKKRELVDLLETQRRAVVNRAVTKGLDDVEMKDSESRFFPKLPAHWDETQLKHLCTDIADGPHYSPSYVDEGIPFLSVRNVKVDRWDFDDVVYVSQSDYEDFCERVVPEYGDVLYTKGGTTGIARAVDFEDTFHVWVHLAVLKVRTELVDPFFLANLLNSQGCYDQSQLYTRGAANQDLGLTRMARIELPLPPLDEQERIVEHIDAQTADIDAAIERTDRQIDLMQQYRTSLVTEVVTGAVDVRAEVAA